MVTAVTTTFLGKPVLTSLFKNAKNMVSINENMFNQRIYAEMIKAVYYPALYLFVTL